MLNKSKYEMWLNMTETQEVFKAILEEIEGHEKNVLQGGYLNSDNAAKIASQYSYDIGYLDGLKFFKKNMFGYVFDDDER